MDERIYQIALSLLQGIGPIKAKMLVAYTGGLEAVFKARKKELSLIEGIGMTRVKKLNRKEALIRAEQELNFVEKNGISLHYYQDANYPSNLKFCEDGPVLLYSKGKINFARQNIAIVGTRRATNYGKSMAQQLITDLAPFNVQIVSGLAHGIDKVAHEAALKNNLNTIAVLGHGLDSIYPAAHKSLAEQMLNNGGLVTEYISKTPGDPTHFPQRNRIVAGLCDATVVIESAASGGSLITANLAFDYNREVFAFPGNADRQSSKGCNLLIRKEKARLITCSEDLLAYMDWDIDERPQMILQEDLLTALTTDEERIIKSMKESDGAMHIDTISASTGFDSSEASLLLFNLEMRGSIRSMPGKKYVLM